MFENGVEIQSPGALANNLTVDDLTYRQSTRNGVLATALGRMSSGKIGGAGMVYSSSSARRDRSVARRHISSLSVGRNSSSSCRPRHRNWPPARRVVITGRHAGQPVADARLLALFPNRTWKQAVIGPHTGHLPMSVFAAAEGFAAQAESGWIPAQGPLTLELNRLPGGGSVIVTAERLWCGSSTLSDAPHWWSTGRSMGQRAWLDCRYVMLTARSEESA